MLLKKKIKHSDFPLTLPTEMGSSQQDFSCLQTHFKVFSWVDSPQHSLLSISLGYAELLDCSLVSKTLCMTSMVAISNSSKRICNYIGNRHNVPLSLPPFFCPLLRASFHSNCMLYEANPMKSKGALPLTGLSTSLVSKAIFWPSRLLRQSCRWSPFLAGRQELWDVFMTGSSKQDISSSRTHRTCLRQLCSLTDRLLAQ